jgi:type II secretory ATPase GspE/PulE/Tfp pilus assembly ATPase PilB-like protein
MKVESIASVPDFVSKLLAESCAENVSDIHIDPEDKQTSIRVRAIGAMKLLRKTDKKFHEELIGRIKVLSRLRTDVHDKGQDGRFSFTAHDEKVDVRVSILPTFYGENAVLRLLRPERGTSRKLEELGMSTEQAAVALEELQRHQGMIIVAGPTGCGKTTTIYTLVAALMQAERNVVTIEDPIEYLIPGIRQIQVSDQADFNFAKALRSILRQDPDVIVVGEMRDGETASLAFQASLTGHLVITSLHAEDSAGICARLRDLGISKELLHSLSLVVSQRLITIGGRRGVFEVLPVKGNIKLALFQNSFPEYIRLTLHKHGALLLQDSAAKVYEAAGQRLDEKEILKIGLPFYDI